MTHAEALAILKTGANVFLTGEPGSGKTYTVNKYVDYLQSCGIEPSITASTGIAATHIGGMTIHSWGGIGIKDSFSEQDIDAISQIERIARRVQAARVLIIDEISMLSADTLAAVEAVCRAVRRSDMAFGGLQTILVGDFFQLPPVVRRDDGNRLELGLDERIFAFHSPAWERLQPVVCYLSEQYRQEDAIFLDALSALRRSEVTEAVRVCFQGRCITPPAEGVYTKLFPHNADVDRLNEIELGKLPGQPTHFAMQSRGRRTLVETLKRNCLSPETLGLKIGAKVMFTKNSPEGRYVNGTIGEVIEFDHELGYPLVKTNQGRTIMAEPVEWAIQDNGRVLAGVTQVPLRLAWAITVHKSQGMSLDAAVIDLSAAFEYGQGYVALSRVRSLAGLFLLGFNERALEVHPEVAIQDEQFRQQSAQAHEALRTLPVDELAVRQANFIRACGGQIGQARKSHSADKVSTYETTKRLLPRRLSITEMAKERGLTTATIVSHLEKLIAGKKIDAGTDLAHIKPDSRRFTRAKAAFAATRTDDGRMPLSSTLARLDDSFSYDELRVMRLFL